MFKCGVWLRGTKGSEGRASGVRQVRPLHPLRITNNLPNQTSVGEFAHWALALQLIQVSM